MIIPGVTERLMELATVYRVTFGVTCGLIALWGIFLIILRIAHHNKH